MSRKRVITEVVVEVTVAMWGRPGPDGYDAKDAQRSAGAMIENIKRHVDDVEWAGWHADTSDECEHCGATWTEDSDTYNGGCCDEDQDPAPTEVTP